MVMVELLPLPAKIGFGPKTLLTLAPGRFVKVADAACVLLAPFVLVTPPTGIVLVRFAFTFIETLKVNEQFADAARLPPLNENEVSPGVALIVPPHVPTFGLAGLAIYIPPPMPCGRLSVKAMPDNATEFGFES